LETISFSFISTSLSVQGVDSYGKASVLYIGHVLYDTADIVDAVDSFTAKAIVLRTTARQLALILITLGLFVTFTLD